MCAALCVVPAAGCGTTVDSLGHDRPRESDDLRPLSGPDEYPNALRDVLGLTDEEIADRLDASFDQLFYGDPENEAIYVEVGDDQAYIEDVYHGDVRTEGIGYGMLIAVQLDKRDEFDRLWRYTKSELEFTSGPGEGYFLSKCDAWNGPVPCADPFGQQQIAMALLLAHGRWGSDTGSIDYGADALSVLEVMRYKEEQNGGVVDGVTNTFDTSTKLAFDFPHVASSKLTRPSNEMPAYYELWAQATGDPFWYEAAASAREYWKRVAHPTTGLTPVRAYFDGSPVLGADFFGSESYRTQLNMAIDHLWFGTEPWLVEHADRLLAFFSGQGIDKYVASYTLDGKAMVGGQMAALVTVNGVTGLVATTEERAAFIEAAWNEELQVGDARYYPGLLHLVALLTLSGQFRVY
ncbi:glycosyl hydrolase family 8 [Sorangium cellulosum]|uniref:glycosyl hydrolase family 8 n=1 Tax=Sorangium cellulosum TaxID=56 RepID=UPI001F5DEEB8|nr:glycosyl hydrolase family 8 [Sorangium cellulosum]